MPYKIIKGMNEWEIIVRELSTGEEFSLNDIFKTKCPICFYPERKEDCHEGLVPHLNKFTYKTCHYYITDYRGNPINWFGELITNIRKTPYKYSHEIISLLLQETLKTSCWGFPVIKAATMVPTTNQQLYDIFEEVSISLGMRWIDPFSIFKKQLFATSSRNRREQVNQKYALTIIDDKTKSLLNDIHNILIFDDILNRGYTFGRMIELLTLAFHIQNYYLITIARIAPKSFPKILEFP